MLSRFTAARRVPSVIKVTKRFNGASKEFNEKEKAHELEYIRRHEAEKLAKLKEDIKKQQAELKELEDAAGKRDGKPKSS